MGTIPTNEGPIAWAFEGYGRATMAGAQHDDVAGVRAHLWQACHTASMAGYVSVRGADVPMAWECAC